jgi:hypothetical protein
MLFKITTLTLKPQIMKKSIMFAAVVLMSTGMFANNSGDESKKTESEIKKEIITTLPEIESQKEILIFNQEIAREAEVDVTCEDGSSWHISCDGCSVDQLVDIAIALCS